MIYLDPSVALAQLFAEDRQPPEHLWREPLTASRLLRYEAWARVHARRLEAPHGDKVRALLAMDFLRGHGQAIELASYDARLLEGARALRIPIRRL